MPQLASLDDTALDALLGQSLLTTASASDERIAAVVSLAEAFAALDRAGVRTPLCPQELAYAVFFDNSTRTKSAWAGAAARLGMAPVIVDGSSTQVSHGETAAETGARRRKGWDMVCTKGAKGRFWRRCGLGRIRATDRLPA